MGGCNVRLVIFALLSLVLWAAPVAAQEVSLSWKQVASPGAGVDRFDIYRKTQTTAYSKLATIEQRIDAVWNEALQVWESQEVTVETIDATTRPGNTYTYKVRAVNTIGESGDSEERSITINGIWLTVRDGQSVAISRRATNSSSIVAILVNKDEVVTVNGVQQ